MLGSPHRKEFRLTRGLDAEALEVRRAGGHSHLRTQSKYSKLFCRALAQPADDGPKIQGRESVILNDILASSTCSTTAASLPATSMSWKVMPV